MGEGGIPTWDEVQKSSGSSGRRLKLEAAKLAKKELASATQTYRDERTRSLEHDAMIDTCASIFMPDSPIQRTTGYTFLSAEPLLETGAKSFDVWLHNLRTRSAVFVECKSSVAIPRKEIDSAYQAIREVQKKRDYLGRIAGEEFAHVEFVLCVEAAQDQRVAEALGAMEASGDISGDEPRLLLWRMNQLEGQTLQFFRIVPGRTNAIENRHRDPQLARALRDPVRASGSQLRTRVFPSSHITRKSLAVLQEVIQRNLEISRDTSLIRVSEVRDFFGSPTNLGHYAASQLEPSITSNFLKDGREAGAIVPADGGDPELLRITATGRRVSTVLSRYESSLDDTLILRLARRRALQTLFGREEGLYPRLETFAPSDPG